MPKPNYPPTEVFRVRHGHIARTTGYETWIMNHGSWIAGATLIEIGVHGTAFEVVERVYRRLEDTFYLLNYLVSRACIVSGYNLVKC